MIDINENEVYLTCAEFKRRQDNRLFEKVYVSADDKFKICGEANDAVYVSERPVSSLSAEEIIEYRSRFFCDISDFEAVKSRAAAQFNSLSENEREGIRRGVLK